MCRPIVKLQVCAYAELGEDGVYHFCDKLIPDVSATPGPLLEGMAGDPAYDGWQQCSNRYCDVRRGKLKDVQYAPLYILRDYMAVPEFDKLSRYCDMHRSMSSDNVGQVVGQSHRVWPGDLTGGDIQMDSVAFASIVEPLQFPPPKVTSQHPQLSALEEAQAIGRVTQSQIYQVQHDELQPTSHLPTKKTAITTEHDTNTSETTPNLNQQKPAQSSSKSPNPNRVTKPRRAAKAKVSWSRRNHRTPCPISECVGAGVEGLEGFARREDLENHISKDHGIQHPRSFLRYGSVHVGLK